MRLARLVRFRLFAWLLEYSLLLVLLSQIPPVHADGGVIFEAATVAGPGSLGNPSISIVYTPRQVNDLFLVFVSALNVTSITDSQSLVYTRRLAQGKLFEYYSLDPNLKQDNVTVTPTAFLSTNRVILMVLANVNSQTPFDPYAGPSGKTVTLDSTCQVSISLLKVLKGTNEIVLGAFSSVTNANGFTAGITFTQSVSDTSSIGLEYKTADSLVQTITARMTNNPSTVCNGETADGIADSVCGLDCTLGSPPPAQGPVSINVPNPITRQSLNYPLSVFSRTTILAIAGIMLLVFAGSIAGERQKRKDRGA